MRHNLDIQQEELEKINIIINIDKTEAMIIANCIRIRKVTLEGKEIEQVKAYKYLGLVITVKAYKYLGLVITGDGRIDHKIDENMGSVNRIFNLMQARFCGKISVDYASQIRRML